MPISFVKIPKPEPQVGQVWECTQAHHKGWKVEVVKVSSGHIEAVGLKGNKASQSKAHSANGNYNYLKAQFERDYMLISDTLSVLETTLDTVSSLNEPVLTEPAELPIICKRCNEMKAAEHYRRILSYGKRMSVCNACMVKAQQLGRINAIAAKDGRKPLVITPEHINPEPKPTPVGQSAQSTQPQQTQASELANQLLTIAAKVDQLSYPTGLLTCVRDLLLEVTDAHGVCIVPQLVIDRLTQEFNLVKGQVSWNG